MLIKQELKNEIYNLKFFRKRYRNTEVKIIGTFYEVKTFSHRNVFTS